VRIPLPHFPQNPEPNPRWRSLLANAISVSAASAVAKRFKNRLTNNTSAAQLHRAQHPSFHKVHFDFLLCRHVDVPVSQCHRESAVSFLSLLRLLFEFRFVTSPSWLKVNPLDTKGARRSTRSLAGTARSNPQLPPSPASLSSLSLSLSGMRTHSKFRARKHPPPRVNNVGASKHSSAIFGNINLTSVHKVAIKL